MLRLGTVSWHGVSFLCSSFLFWFFYRIQWVQWPLNVAIQDGYLQESSKIKWCSIFFWYDNLLKYLKHKLMLFTTSKIRQRLKQCRNVCRGKKLQNCFWSLHSAVGWDYLHQCYSNCQVDHYRIFAKYFSASQLFLLFNFCKCQSWVRDQDFQRKKKEEEAAWAWCGF